MAAAVLLVPEVLPAVATPVAAEGEGLVSRVRWVAMAMAGRAAVMLPAGQGEWAEILVAVPVRAATARLASLSSNGGNNVGF